MKNKLGEMHCPNCDSLLTIWEAKTGSGFVSCGFCGLKGYNIQPKSNPIKEGITKEVEPEAQQPIQPEPEFKEAESGFKDAEKVET